MINWQHKKELALGVPLATILSREGFHPTPNNPKVYRSPFRDEKNASFRIRNDNTWIDYGLVGAHNWGDTINLIQLIKNCDYKTAVNYIVDVYCIGCTVPERPALAPRTAAPSVSPVTIKHKVDRVTELRHPALVRYLEVQRLIPIEIARQYCREVHYTYLPTGRPFFGIGFPNDNGGWVIRTAPFGPDQKGQKFDILASGISTIRVKTGMVNQIGYVFEGFMNFLSYLVISGRPLDGDAYVLNSCQNVGALRGIAATGVAELEAYPDNDAPGREAFRRLQTEAGCTVIDASDIYRSRGLNDLNEHLLDLHTPGKCV